MTDPESLLGLVAVVVSLAAVTSGSITLLQVLRPDMLPAIAFWLVFNLGVIAGGVGWHLISERRRAAAPKPPRYTQHHIRSVESINRGLQEVNAQARQLIDDIRILQSHAEQITAA